MKYYLTSSTHKDEEMVLEKENGFVERLLEDIGDKKINCIVISSEPDDVKGCIYYGELVKKRMENSGIKFNNFDILHNKNYKKLDVLIDEADMIFLMGGHVPTQNKFLHKIRLKKYLDYFDGIVLALSAGSMNSAEFVYAMPEIEGEAKDTSYQKILEGLGITFKMIIPHYTEDTRSEELDGLNVFNDILIPDSKNNEFYVFPDGTYIYGDGKNEKIFGDYFVIKNGKIIE